MSREACGGPPSPASSEGEEPRSSSSCSRLSPASRPSSRSCEEDEEEEREAASQSRRGDRVQAKLQPIFAAGAAVGSRPPNPDLLLQYYPAAGTGNGRPGLRPAQEQAQRAEDCEKIGGRNHLPLKDNLSPWEEWFICKEKELRVRLQARALEKINLQLEKTKEKQDSERRRRLAEEKHKEWVQRKKEEERRERERKLSKEMAEKATRELEKMQLQEKAKVKYKEWLKKKRAEESEKKKKEKEKEKEREAELQEKKERSEKIFQEWLHNARNKARPVLNGYGYPHGKSTGCYDGISYPTPAYCNPIPWKPIHVPPPKEDSCVSVKSRKRSVYPQSCRSSPVVTCKPHTTRCVGSLHRKQL